MDGTPLYLQMQHVPVDSVQRLQHELAFQLRHFNYVCSWTKVRKGKCVP